MRQVPWESWKQWHHTHRCLFSSDSSLVAKALDRITAWQCRGRVPVAVEITGELISIHQRDPQFTAGLQETAILPAEMLRMMYAMAIMRLVNGVVDQSQKRNTTSVALRAEAAELPRVLVDIRHEAAHNELPSLPLLQHGSKKALDWLWSHYWDVQQQALLDAHILLRLKLVQHSEMVHKALQPSPPPPPPPQQPPLVSEEVEKGEKQSRKQLKKNSKEALRSAKQRQRVVFRELLDLAQFAVGDVVALLVDGGLLVHDPSWTTTILSVSAADVLEANVNGDDEIVKDPLELLPPSGNVETEMERSLQDDERTAPWKQTISQLSFHIPQLPTLLLVAIVEHLASSSSRYSSIIGGSGSPQKLAKTSLVVLDSTYRERFLEWVTWILNEAISLSDDRRTATSALLGSAARIGSRHKIRQSVGLSKELLQELVGICLRSSTMDKFLLKLVPLLARYFGDSSYARCLVRLAGLAGGGGDGLLKEHPVSKGGLYSVEPSDVSEHDNKQNSGLGNANNTNSSLHNVKMLSPELAVKEAKEQQQAILNNRSVVACEVLEGHVQSAAEIRSQDKAGQHCKIVARWRPCAVGMLPSSVDCMGTIPKFSVDDIEDDDVLSAIEVTKGKVAAVGEEDWQATSVKDSEAASTQTTDQQQAEEEETVSSCKKRKELESHHAGEEGPTENDTAKRRRDTEEMNKNCPIDNNSPATNGEDEVEVEDEKYPRWPGIFLLQRHSLEPHVVEELQAAIHLL